MGADRELAVAVVVVAGVDIAPHGAATASATIAYIAAAPAQVPVADIAAEWGAVASALAWIISSLLAKAATLLLAVAALSTTIACLLPAALAVLTLAVLTLAILALPVLRLAVLILPVLPGPAVAAARSCHGFNLVAQTLHLIERRGLVALLSCAALTGLALPHSLLRLAKLLAQLAQSLRNFGLRAIGVWIDPAAQPVRSLHMVVQIGLIHPGQRIAQLLRNPRLIGGHLARGIADIFLQAGQLVGELLPLLRKLVALADEGRHVVHVGCAGITLLAGQFVDPVCLRMFFLRQLTGLARQGVDFAGRELLLRAGEQVGGIAQTVGGLLRGVCTLLRRAAALHGIGCLLKTVERLFNPLI